MTKASIIKLVGTIASAVVASGAVFVRDPNWRAIVLASATLALGWLHLPRPGDVPAASLPPGPK